MTISAVVETTHRQLKLQVDVFLGECWESVVWDDIERFLNEHGYPEESVLKFVKL